MALLGLTTALSTPDAQAAERVVFVSGAFRRSIPVADLDHLAQTGQARGLLSDLLRFSRQRPTEVAKLLNQPITLPLVLTSRLLGTRIGDALLQRVSRVIAPSRAPGMGVPALRSAVILGLDQGGGTLTPTGFLRAYPTEELAINVPALLSIIGKASSIADLVRFFSESPLDGLRGDAAPSPAPGAAGP